MTRTDPTGETMSTQANFVNVHVLHPVPFSNPNRDDTGSPKNCVFGGTTRSRMSSQSMKRAAREWFEGVSGADRTARTKHAAADITERAVAAIEADGGSIDDDQRDELADRIGKAVRKLTGNPEKRDDQKDTLVWIAEQEAAVVAARAVRTVTGTDMEADDVLATLDDATRALTIAGFGRMFANRADLQVEAAVQVAHAFTTHAQQNELDYFTAVEDLSHHEPEHGAGAGHLDVAEYTSGVYYRYLSIDRDQLAENWIDIDADDAEERLVAWVRALIERLPTGKETTTGHHTIPAYVMIMFGDQPLSYAPAFEAAVSPDGGGYLRPSVDALSSYAEKVARATRDTGEPLTFDIDDPDSPTLGDLYERVAEWLVSASEIDR